MMNTSDFDYFLPPERIAQTPLEPRDASKLLVYSREHDEVNHRRFSDIAEILKPGDLLVRNQTRVLPARLFATKEETGGKVEILLLRQRAQGVWDALVGGKRILPNTRLRLANDVFAVVAEQLNGARRILHFEGGFDTMLEAHGVMPLPPYIHERLQDPERYQTIYADRSKAGSAAAPTAGLHFTEALIQKLKNKGVLFADVTLHVGLDTFQPVGEDHPEDHVIHQEWCELSQSTADMIRETKVRGNRVIAVGTTSARVLESAAQAAIRDGSTDSVIAFSGDTGIYILPGYEFQAIDGIITNFHLPKSTLIMMVSAFAGREKILALYQEALAQQYRFFSFGDAMLIL